MSSSDTTVRQALLGVSLAVLMITAGCAGVLPQNSGQNSEVGTSTPTVTPSQHKGNSVTSSSTDLRSISIPDNGSETAAGELDRGDPKSGSKYYEPVQVAAAEGQIVNITMRAESDSRPAIRVRNPDGNVTEVISNESGNATGFIRGKFTHTGQFTFEATSVNQNARFNYTLTTESAELPEESEERRELFEGDMSEWNETERYLEFAQDFGDQASDAPASEYGIFPSSDDAVSGGKIAANASGDYVIYTYEVSSDLNLTQRNRVAINKEIIYSSLSEYYREELASDLDYVENGSWVPEIIFFRVVDEDTGELRRTVFLTDKWGQDFAKADTEAERDEAIKVYNANYYLTQRIGPGVSNYDPDSPASVTDSEFPQNYWDWEYPSDTTLAEKYNLTEP